MSRKRNPRLKPGKNLRRKLRRKLRRLLYLLLSLWKKLKMSPMGETMPSARSKKLDQLYISKAELKKNKQVQALKRLVSLAHGEFGFGCADDIGKLFYRRLLKTAKRAKMKPLHYAERVLLK